MTVNEWFGNDGSNLPKLSKDATPAEIRKIRKDLDATVGEDERRRVLGEVACRLLFEANPALTPGFLTRGK